MKTSYMILCFLILVVAFIYFRFVRLIRGNKEQQLLMPSPVFLFNWIEASSLIWGSFCFDKKPGESRRTRGSFRVFISTWLRKTSVLRQLYRLHLHICSKMWKDRCPMHNKSNTIWCFYSLKSQQNKHFFLIHRRPSSPAHRGKKFAVV